jgi:hypothetical protein
MWCWVGLYGRPRGGGGQAVHRRSTCPGNPQLPYNFVSCVIQKDVEPLLSSNCVVWIIESTIQASEYNDF